ncbi:hypothetical protein LOZ53_005985 [Ophidiomyces ophidiicola]|nr:hypothetical protein LOZ53_005985 [Ophidiomyces ophidiicola]
MNWTGGKLFRHSFKDKTTLKAREKLHFAKAKRRAHTSRREPLSPIRVPRSAVDVAGPNPPSSIRTDQRVCNQGSFSGGWKSTENNRRHRVKDTRNAPLSIYTGDQLPPPNVEPDAGTLEDFRRRLLKKHDWADLSISRPVNMRFTSEAERYNYGRRRRLTQADRQRLTVGERRTDSRPPSYRALRGVHRQRKGEYTPTVLNPDDISIRIHKEPIVYLDSQPRSVSKAMSMMSSESMLLDQEENHTNDILGLPSTLAQHESSEELGSFGNQKGTSVHNPARGEIWRYPVSSPVLPDNCGLPVLSRHGTFAAYGPKTWYIAPDVEEAECPYTRENEHQEADTDPSMMLGPQNEVCQEKDQSSKLWRGIPDNIEKKTNEEQSRVQVFFGQRVNECAKDCPDPDEIWKRLVFKPQETRNGGDLIRKTIRNDGEDMSSIHETDGLIDNDFNSTIGGEAVQTVFNTSLNCVDSIIDNAPSETDFLSQFSPMGGYIDEFLSEISMHNNARGSTLSAQPTSLVDNDRGGQDCQSIGLVILLDETDTMRIRILHTAFLFIPVTSLSVPYTKPTPLPLVLWHGLGDDFGRDGLKEISHLVEKVNPGTYVHIIRLDTTPEKDREATFFGNVTEQVETVCEQLASDPILNTAPAINALGFSQGGQFLRAYVERCNKPPVHNLVTFGSQHNGIASFQSCASSGDWICRGGEALLRFGVWSNFVQSGFVPAQYFRNPEQLDQYLQHSNFLADVNNERTVKNAKYRQNLMSLNKFVMYMFKDDKMVKPKQSSHFAEVNQTTGEVTPLRERQIYQEDWLGLKSMDEAGKLEFLTIPGEHMQVTSDVMMQTIERYFGSVQPDEYSGSGLVLQVQ